MGSSRKRLTFLGVSTAALFLAAAMLGSSGSASVGKSNGRAATLRTTSAKAGSAARAPASLVGVAHSQTGAPGSQGGALTPTGAWIPGTPYPVTDVRYAFADSGEDLYVIGGVSN